MTEPRTPIGRERAPSPQASTDASGDSNRAPNASALPDVATTLAFAARVGPRTLELVSAPDGRAALTAALAAGFTLEDAVLQVVYPRAQRDRVLLEEFLRFMQPEFERIGELAIQPRLRAKLDKLDVCQSVIGDLLPRLPEIQFRTRSEFCAYLLNKMRWKATDRGRQRIAAEERERRVAEGERGAARPDVPQPVEALIEVEDRRRMQEVLAQMTPREQEVLRLHLDERTPKEIAEQLGMTRDAVYKALQRGMARAKLMG